MATFEELVEDYSRHQVPEHKTVGGVHIGIIIIGVGITITAFILGSQMGMRLGFRDSLHAFYLGGFLLAIVAGFTGVVGAATRLSTAMIIKSTFGETGAKFVNSVLTLVMMGWCMVLAAFFGDAMHAGLETNWGVVSLPREFYVALGSAVMALITIFGFKALDKQSLVMVPIMLGFLFTVLYLSLRRMSLSDIAGLETATDPAMGLGAATSIVVGSFIVGATIFPDICRYVRNRPQAVTGSFIAFLLGYPVILILSAIPSIATGEADLMTVVTMLGFSVLGFVFLVLASLTTGTFQLYSASLAFAALVKTEKWKLVIVIAVITTVVAIFFSIDYFLDWLTFLSILIPPISGIYVTHHLLTNRRGAGRHAAPDISMPAFGAWTAGTIVAFIAHNGLLQFTSIAAIDAILVASFCYYLLQTLTGKNTNET